MLPFRPAKPQDGSRDQVRRSIIDAVSDYYRFLTRMPHVDPNDLVFPPEPEGWKGINEDELRARGRSEEAIDLLRHLPYLRNAGFRDPTSRNCTRRRYGEYNITDDSVSIAFCDGELEHEYCHQQQPTPGHVIWFANHDEKYGSYLLLDTLVGTITRYCFIDPGAPCPDTYAYGTLDEADEWMNCPTLPVGDFFDNCKRRYEKLVWLPVPGEQQGNSCGSAHHYWRIDSYFADYYCYTDDEYVDGESDSSSSTSSSPSENAMHDDDGVIPEDEVNGLLQDHLNGYHCDACLRTESEASIRARMLTAPPVPLGEDDYEMVEDYEVVEDDYETETNPESLKGNMKKYWQYTKEVYYIYKNNGWPAVDYNRARCTQELKEWLENKERKEREEYLSRPRK